MEWFKRLAALALVGLLSCAASRETYSGPPQVAPRAPRPAPLQLAQVQARGGIVIGPTEVMVAGEGVFLPPEYESRRRLEKARAAIREDRYGDAVQLLGVLLETPEDYFFKPDPSKPDYQSLRGEAGRMMAEMPKAGLEAYELQYGARARQMLRDAIEKRDVSGLEDVARRFFYTRAGAQATLLLGRHHFDANRPLAAALCFARLRGARPLAEPFEPALSVSLAASWLRGGMPERAKQTVATIPAATLRRGLIVAGERLMLSGDSTAVLALVEKHVGAAVEQISPQLTGWPMFRGDASRNAASQGGRPLLSHRWRQRVADFEDTKHIRQLRQVYLDQDAAAIPGIHPLAVGSVVLMRTPRSLLAVDFATGKRVWEARPALDRTLEPSFWTTRSQRFVGAGGIAPTLEQRMWEDATFGTLSSDGELVFAVDELGPDEDGSSIAVYLTNGQKSTATGMGRMNRLTAYELRTEGKLKWEVGGETGGGNYGTADPRLAGAYFLGPPLPAMGRLYALAEMKGQEIRLLVLSPHDGTLLWSQQLAVAELNSELEPQRRWSGAAPSLADGVLVCPTSVGAAVAVDVTTRALLWGFQYQKSSQVDRYTLRNIYGNPLERRPGDHWADNTATIYKGNVLLTPPEADQLYCLNLLDGKLLWKLDRGGNLYVACIHKDQVILVGSHEVTALHVSDGGSAWKQPLSLPSGSMPSGRGFYSGEHYYLPLTTGEVAQIDLDEGKIKARNRSRHGDIPGNLICFQGQVISQGVEFLDAYYELESLKREVQQLLAKEPRNAQSLARLGEIKLDERKINEAIEAFRTSYEIERDDHTRQLLVESVLEGLRTDFAAHRATASQIEPLMDQRQQRAAYLRLTAAGLRRQGELSPALDAYLKLADETADPAELSTIDESLEVRGDRFLQAQLASLRSDADGPLQARIDQLVAERLTKARTAGSPDVLREFLAMFGNHPASDEAREELLKKLNGIETLQEKEILLRELERSSSEATSRSSTARLAKLLIEARRPDLAATYYEKLLQKWPNMPCLDGLTGKQIVAQLPNTGDVRRRMAAAKPWPSGNINVSEGPGRSSVSPARMRPVELEFRGARKPYFQDLNVSLDPVQHILVARDQLGTERFRVSIGQPMQRRGSFGAFAGTAASAASHIRAYGSLMLVSTGTQLVAIDGLRSGPEASGRILWSQEMVEQSLGSVQPVQPQQLNVPWGFPRYQPTDAYQRPIGSTGPITSRGVVFQRFRDVLCVDPLRGTTLWTRKNVAAGSELFGDEETLFIAAPDADTATALRPLDGELLGTRSLPRPEERMTTLGRLVLAWRSDDDRQVLELVDAWVNETKWSHRFSAQAKVWLIGDEAVGVLEPAGTFAIVSVPDGRSIVQEDLGPQAGVREIFVLRHGKQFLLLTSSTSREDDGFRNGESLNLSYVRGKVYAFDAETGKRMWAKPAAVDQYGLWLNQPADLPLLVLVRQGEQGWRAGRGDARTSIMYIDKRSGRTGFVKRSSLPGAVPNFEIVGDAEKNTVSVLFPGKTVALTLTDEPITHDSNSVTEVFGAVLRALGGGIKDVAPPLPNVDDD